MSAQHETCEACEGVGLLATNNDTHGFRIERCDACETFDSDEAAIRHAVACVNGCKGLVDLEITVPELVAALEFYANPENWREQETGIGMSPAEAHDYGARAEEALTKVKTRAREAELQRRTAQRDELLAALKLAVAALNEAPRFAVPSEDTNSYKIASICDAAIRKATAQP